jgi:O-antigen/teichoic acid export membrane protein
MLLALGETSRFSAITIVTVILGLVAALVFLPFWGMNRAARAFAMILAAVLTFLVLSRKLRLQLDLKGIWKSLVAGTVMAIAVFAVQISLYSRFFLPLYALVGALTCFVSLRIQYAIKLSCEEAGSRRVLHPNCTKEGANLAPMKEEKRLTFHSP